jgi:hypothetical protein
LGRLGYTAHEFLGMPGDNIFTHQIAIEQSIDPAKSVLSKATNPGSRSSVRYLLRHVTKRIFEMIVLEKKVLVF